MSEQQQNINYAHEAVLEAMAGVHQALIYVHAIDAWKALGFNTFESYVEDVVNNHPAARPN